MGGRGSKSASAASMSAALPGGLKQYAPWQSEKISDSDKNYVIGDWKGSSSKVRHAINGRANSTMNQKTAEQFDDWLNSGSYSKTLYRGKRMTKDQLAAIEVGDIVNQDGPASFSKSKSVAQTFAGGGYNYQSGATQRTIFVLNGGTKAGRDISGSHGFASEHEVCVGSASHLKVTNIHTELIHGRHYTFIEGTEIKAKYESPHH